MKVFRIKPVEQLAQQKQELEEFLHRRVYRHPRLLETRDTAQKQLEVMFRGYLADPELLPTRFQQRAQHVGLPRSVGDYLAGMTDRYCDQQFNQFFSG
jgi:dGTPase